jgi:hypothetical protein
MRILCRFGVLATVLVAGAFVVACGGTVIDDVKTEETLEQNLERSTGKKINSVECPSGVDVDPGTTFECTVRVAGGGQETAVLKVLNDDADVEVTDLKAQG